jgi:transcription antitermination factor NusG
MNKPSFAEGDLVKVTSGAFADAVGVVDDLRDDCTAVRIHAKDGPVYAFTDTVVKLPTPGSRVALNSNNRPVIKKN